MDYCTPTLFLWVTAVLTMLISHNLVLPVAANCNSSPASTTVTPSTPTTGLATSLCSHHHGHSHRSHHGGGSGCSGTPTTPVLSPPYAGGGSYYTPPSSGCGGGGHHDPWPPSPHPLTYSTTPSPYPPNTGGGGGGGYYHSPPTTPVTPVTPVTPAPPLIDLPPPTPTYTPSVPSPPISVDPGTGGGAGGGSTPPFTCNYWGSHPTLIWRVLGRFGTVGSLFGVTSSLPGLSLSTSLQHALSSTRPDGFSSLYREGTAAMLNSMATHRFPFTTDQVRTAFVSSLSTDRAAASQARLFRLANEGRLRHL